MLSLHYHELIEKIEEHEGEKYLMVDNYMLDKAFDKIKEIIGIGKLDDDDTKILVDVDNKLPDNVTLKNVVILMTCVMSDDCKFYLELFLGEALFLK